MPRQSAHRPRRGLSTFSRAVGLGAVAVVAAACFEVRPFEPRAVEDALLSPAPDAEGACAVPPCEADARPDAAAIAEDARPAPPVPDIGTDAQLTPPPTDGAPPECRPGDAAEPCWPEELAAQRGVGQCADGARACLPDGRRGDCEGAVLPEAEVPDNEVDEDCDGLAFQREVIEVPKEDDNDCDEICCPDSHPYPAGCELYMGSGCDRGCVAWRPGQQCIWANEGTLCNTGNITGPIFCSNDPEAVIDAANCTTNCDDTLMTDDRETCP